VSGTLPSGKVLYRSLDVAKVYWTATARKAAPSVVTVIALTSDGEVLGTGFYISSDGKVATNHHVIADAQIIRVKSDSSTV
jgi:S1-C subfamily serine protease